MKNDIIFATASAVLAVILAAMPTPSFGGSADMRTLYLQLNKEKPAVAIKCDETGIAIIELSIAGLDSRYHELTAAYERQEADINSRKSDALKELTADFNRLNAQKLKAQGNVAEQSALDAQLKTVQDKIDAVSEPFDEQLKVLSAARNEAKQSYDQQRAQLISRRDQETATCPPKPNPDH